MLSALSEPLTESALLDPVTVVATAQQQQQAVTPSPPPRKAAAPRKTCSTFASEAPPVKRPRMVIPSPVTSTIGQEYTQTYRNSAPMATYTKSPQLAPWQIPPSGSEQPFVQSSQVLYDYPDSAIPRQAADFVPPMSQQNTTRRSPIRQVPMRGESAAPYEVSPPRCPPEPLHQYYMSQPQLQPQFSLTSNSNSNLKYKYVNVNCIYDLRFTFYAVTLHFALNFYFFLFPFNSNFNLSLSSPRSNSNRLKAQDNR